jgi:hypothetical protein
VVNKRVDGMTMPEDGPLQTTQRRPPTVGIGRALAAGVTFVASLVGLLFLLWPGLQPEPPTKTRGGELSHVTIDRNVTFGQYLDRLAQSRAPFHHAQLRRRGALIGFTFSVQGYNGAHLPLRWQLINARTGNQVAQSRDFFIVPEAQRDRNTWSIWVPVQAGRQRAFFVEVELRDARDAFVLDRFRTRRFRGA